MMRHSVTLNRAFLGALAMIAGLGLAPVADAFCGFYVAKADTQLFNKASKVAIARHDGKTVITMANDYQGDPSEFAMVIPVPKVLDKDQIHVTESALIDHLDAYTAPRLVEYFDPNPCQLERRPVAILRARPSASDPVASAPKSSVALGVRIEASYTVGEYDILILSAKQSDGLETWLIQNGYKIPPGASPAIAHYLSQGMKFFVAKVNLDAHTQKGATYLRPLQIAFESPHFMLPIRLGMVNANGPQDLFIFTLTRGGRVETQNYRTTKLPSNLDVPLFVKGEFGDFYQSMFDYQVEKEQMRAVFLEYAWDMGWCDPCAADPLSVDELRELGVFWQSRVADRRAKRQARDVFVTRLHVRYTDATFPNDLVFRETSERQNFQGRYILRHPWRGDRSECRAAESYIASLPQRFEREAQTLAGLTGWKIDDIRRKMEGDGQPVEGQPTPRGRWYQRLWKR